MVSLLDWSELATDIALYTPKHPGVASGYSAEDGPFVDGRCERLGAVGVFNVRFLSTRIEHRFAVFNGGATAPATVGGKPWIADILNDPEWIRDPTKKARDEAMKVIAELEARRAQPPSE